MAGALMMTIVLVVIVGIAAYLVGTLVKSIQNEKRTSMRLWKNFGLSLGFCVLFFVSWAAQGVAEWQRFTDEQKDHGKQPEVGDFVTEFSQSTLENWQSEFLQLFSFTVMAAVLIHKGSAESRDSDDGIQAALKRIEDKLGTEPTTRDEPLRQGKDLHVVPGDFEGWQLRDESSPEPEGYYDKQEDAIAAGRELARKNGVKLYIHGENGLVRDQTGSG
ncbi:MAG TPA: DUF2188 domain-containing protein [Actinomycetota bacterium]|nr:DUF2188 domain-containing protein [Actinomycetota bacterium]